MVLVLPNGRCLGLGLSFGFERCGKLERGDLMAGAVEGARKMLMVDVLADTSVWRVCSDRAVTCCTRLKNLIGRNWLHPSDCLTKFSRCSLGRKVNVFDSSGAALSCLLSFQVHRSLALASPGLRRIAAASMATETETQ